MAKFQRKDWVSWAGVALLFAAMLWGIIAIRASEIRQFRREGVTASATIVDKFTTRSSSTSTSDHNLAVTFMAGGENDEPVHIDMETGEADFGAIDVGVFSRASFEVGNQTYDAIEIGDTVTIYYLPSDPSEALLQSQVDDYNPIFIWVIVGLLVVTAVICLIIAVFAPFAAKSVNK